MSSFKLPPPEAVPHGLKVEHIGNILCITRFWSPFSIVRTFFFILFWVFCTYTWQFVLQINLPTLYSPIWKPIIYWSGPIALLYASLTSLLNSTKLSVGNGKLQVSHGPLPWPGRKINIYSSDIVQLFCKKINKCEGNYHPPIYKYHAPIFHVCALLSNGQEISLLRVYLEGHQVLFIEELIEAKLGIQPRPVEGEMTQDRALQDED